MSLIIMSRLDSFIRRMTAQRDILNALVSETDDLPGAILEFGLGSGRTYDHLRELYPARRVIVFESEARLCSWVNPADLVLGDIRETVSRMEVGCAALIHIDIETGIAGDDAKLAEWLPQSAARLLKPGGFVACGCELLDRRIEAYPLPDTVAHGRYFVGRRCRST